MIQESIHQEDVRKPEMHKPGNRGSKDTRQKLRTLKEEIGKHTGMKSSALLAQWFVEKAENL